MPVESITVEIHSVIESVSSVNDYEVSTAVYSDNAPPTVDTTSLPAAFWENAIATNPGNDAIRLFYQSSLGTTQVAAVLDPHSSVNLWTAIGNPSTQDQVRSDYAFGGGTLFWGVLLEGEVMPTSVLITGDWSFTYDHHFGQDVTSQLGPYTWLDANGVVETTTWEGPLEPAVNDNVFNVGTVRMKGRNWDVGTPEVGVPMFTLGVYQRVALLGSITGEYLGSDRRFMGF